MTSLCNVCYEPGHCCNRFVVNYREPGTAESVVIKAETTIQAAAFIATKGLPFISKEILRDYDNTVIFSCPLVSRDGYCTDYKNRPELCRTYQPKDDAMCVFNDAYLEHFKVEP